MSLRSLPATGRERREEPPVGRFDRIYDGLLIALLLPCSALGVALMGATRWWGSGPLLALLWVACALFCFRMVLARKPGEVRVPPGGWWLTAAWVYGLCTLCWTSVPFDTTRELLTIAGYLAAYWMWCNIPAGAGRWRAWVGILLVIGTVAAWYGIIDFRQESTPFGHLSDDHRYDDRASGIYVSPNHFAHLLELLAPLCLVILFIPAAGYVLRILSVYGLTIFLAAIFLSASRSAWLGIAGGLGITLLLMLWRARRRWFLAALVAGPLLLATVAWSAWTYSPLVQKRVAGMLNPSEDDAVAGRLEIWRDAVRMIKEKPLTGWGPGSFRWVNTRYKSHDKVVLWRYAHNEYLHAVAEYGIPGFLLFAGAGVSAFVFFLAVAVRARRRDHAFLGAGMAGAITASAIHALFDFNLHIFANTHILLMLSAITAAMQEEPNRLRTMPSGGRAPRFAALAIGVGLLFLLFTTVRLGIGYYHLARGQWLEEQRVEYEEAEKSYRRCIEITPEDYRGRIKLGNLLRLRSFWNHDEESRAAQEEQALASYRQAHAQNPMDTESLFGQGMLHLNRGEMDPCIEVLGEVIRLSPRDAFYLMQLGRVFRMAGRYEEAAATYEKVLPLGKYHAEAKDQLRAARKAMARGGSP